jgi:hypothetical protein
LRPVLRSALYPAPAEVDDWQSSAVHRAADPAIVRRLADWTEQATVRLQSAQRPVPMRSTAKECLAAAWPWPLAWSRRAELVRGPAEWEYPAGCGSPHPEEVAAPALAAVPEPNPVDGSPAPAPRRLAAL